ncbi:MazG nucleotide pyrophosphohydrolase domain-containing protein [Kocuria massiliensis]|uniref:MazG nucleotide pyrophosphohydrolase domain-containing protein n=1 Tax=Kocuria massiliensis TaxID=1926282 RepID=UPI0022B9688F|nr:MazG nucleotide pyrophosphohydrolase domain-containing protein [Kocuria massiliensis]
MTQRAQDQAAEEFSRLVTIMDRLRSPGGCPWDGEQTHASLVRYLIEEAYEVVEAIEAPEGVNTALLREELGDVLLQVVFHARIAREAPDGFGIADVVRGLNEKLVRRHPHVFADSDSVRGDDAPSAPASARGVGNSDLEELTRRWDDIKRAEKPERRDPFDGIPPALPALAFAEKALNKAAKASLPLPDERGYWPGGRPETTPPPAAAKAGPSEGRAAAETRAPGRTPDVEVSPESVVPGSSTGEEDRLGRELLGLVVEARRRGVDPEKALRGVVREFTDSSRGIT